MSRTTGNFKSERSSKSGLCRLCRKSNSVYYNIFTSNIACKITVKEALNDLVGLQVAVGDGLPNTMCPLCLKKLTEFSVFKKICLESNRVLRTFSPRNYGRSIQGDEATDDELGSSADSKDFIQDEIQGTSHLTHSVQRTEIYIPVQDSHQFRAHMLETVKDENKDPLSEGNYPVMKTQDPDGISSNALDPLATDDLSGIRTCGSPSVKVDQCSDDGGGYARNDSTNGASNNLLLQGSDPAKASISSLGKEGEAEGTRAVVIDLDTLLVLAKNELSPKETDATEPIDTENVELVQNRTMVMESMKDAAESAAPGRASALFSVHGPKIRDEREVRRSFIVDGKSCTVIPHTSKNSYSCNDCDKSFSCKSHLVRHSLTHTKEKPYSCNECGKSFSLKGNLVHHIRIHTKEKPYSCNECDKSFSRKSTLVRHIRTHTKEKPYSCNECDKSFSQKITLVRHIRTHTKEKPYSCNECDKSFSVRSYLFSHKRIHTKEKPYSCNDCDKSFCQKNSLVRHMRTHTKEKPYSCRECNKSFSRKSHLVCHIRTHTNDKPYSCRECEKSFSHKNTLVNHIRTHSKERPYSCNECEKSFSQKSNLDRHIWTHAKEKPYSCNECDKCFSHKNTLVGHIRTHTKEKPYSCNECDKSFSVRSGLFCHMRVHTKEKPFSCNECDKSFSFRSSLVWHMRNHSKQKPYSCNECNKSFARKNSLVGHMRTHTKEKPY